MKIGRRRHQSFLRLVPGSLTKPLPGFTAKNPIRGEIQQWYRIDKMISGLIYGDRFEEYKDGSKFYTAIIKEVVNRGDYYLVKTHESHYILYKDKCDKGKNNGILL